MDADEIQIKASNLSVRVIEFLYALGRVAEIPEEVIRVIPLGMAAALFYGSGIGRQQAIAALSEAFDKIERKH